jgi:hypothetical protein
VRKDALDTLTELRYDSCHPFAGLSEGRSVYIGLRGDTTYVQAGSSDVFSLEDDNLQALLGGIFSGTVSSRSRTYNA